MSDTIFAPADTDDRFAHLAVASALRNFGPEYGTVLEISESISHGKRIPEIDNMQGVKNQLRRNVTVSDFEQSEVQAEAIIAEWKNAAGKRTGSGQFLDMRDKLDAIKAGDMSALSDITKLFGFGAEDDPDIATKRKELQAAQEELNKCTTETYKAQAKAKVDALSQEYNALVMGKQLEAQAPRESFRLAAQIVALGRGCVDDSVYDRIVSIIG